MNKGIVNTNVSDYQLISIAIDLVGKVFGLMDCNPELASNPHAAKAMELANKWNDKFIQVYLTTEGK